jgi:hypothetical protein
MFFAIEDLGGIIPVLVFFFTIRSCYYVFQHLTISVFHIWLIFEVFLRNEQKDIVQMLCTLQKNYN